MLQSALARESHPHLKIIWFEDMKADLRKILGEFNKFLELGLADEQLAQLKDHLSIDQMRKAATSAATDRDSKEWMNKFFRKGIVGDGRDQLSEGKQKVWDDWIRTSLAGTSVAARFH